MSHNIEHYTYSENKSKEAIQRELDAYVRKATWREGGQGLDKNIRFIDRVLPDYETAEEFLKSEDRGWYDQLAVKYKEMPRDIKSKKLEELYQKLAVATKEFTEANSIIVAKEFKSEFVSCKECKSKINKMYLNSNKCPVCHTDMRSDTVQKRLAALNAKVVKLRNEIKTEENRIIAKSGKVCWLVKIEYHT